MIILVAALVVGSGVAGAVVATSAHGVRPTTTDLLVRTTESTPLSATGGVQTVVEHVVLPPGRWVLYGDDSLVNFAASDYTRCTLFEGSTALSGHATMVGDPTAAGALGPAAFVATLSVVDAVSLRTPTEVSVDCEHDHTDGAAPYVDADATLWAHRSSGLQQMVVK
jgi:hypothetical protein